MELVSAGKALGFGELDLDGGVGDAVFLLTELGGFVQSHTGVVTEQVATEGRLADTQRPNMQVMHFLHSLQLHITHILQITFNAREVQFIRHSLHQHTHAFLRNRHSRAHHYE